MDIHSFRTRPTRFWPSRFVPKLVTCLREGYTGRTFASDLLAGLTVAVIALPLAMALGIASIPQNVADELRAIHPWLTPPAMGLFTVVIAGFAISALGGSRTQIGGPTAAFIPIVFGIASQFGYAGLALATMMAGVLVILMGLFRFGALIKFIPYPVTTGFTAGIAVTIIASQLKDFLGLSVLTNEGTPATIPAEVVPKLSVLFEHIGTINWHAAGVGAGSLALLIVLRKLAPRVPGAVVAAAGAAAFVWLMGWAGMTETLAGGHTRPLVETIGTRFGSLPSSLPPPRFPEISLSMVGALMPAAMTIAVLCAIESLLSAVVADGMTGTRHRSDQELVAQGVANIGSAFFFGLPATGAIARTAANIKAGGKTPVAGIAHALFVLLAMVALAPIAKLIPLPTLAAILMIVAWNIAEVHHFRSLLRAPSQDVMVLLATFALTVFIDLTVGVGVGMVLASFLFMKRMSEVSGVAALRPSGDDESGDGTTWRDTVALPEGVEVFEINGPFFFGVADRLQDVLRQSERSPRVFVLHLRNVPHVDATAMHALEEFHSKCRKQGSTLVLAGVSDRLVFYLWRVGVLERIGQSNIFPALDEALAHAGSLVGATPEPATVS